MFFKKKEKSEVLQEAPLGYWEEKLKEMNVVRIHKSFLVNLANAQLEGNEMKIAINA